MQLLARFPWSPRVRGVAEVAPDAVRWRGHRAGAFSVRPLTGQADAGAAQAAAQALVELVAAEVSPRISVRLCIADSWLRPLVLPLRGDVASDFELDLLASHALAEAYGIDPRQWSIRWSRQRGHSLLAVACPLPLAELPAQAGSVDVAWQSIVPASVERLGQVDLDASGSWMLLLARLETVAVLAQSGEWQVWRVLPAGDGDDKARLDWFLRAVAQSGAACRHVVLVPDEGAADAASLQERLRQLGWSVTVQVSE